MAGDAYRLKVVVLVRSAACLLNDVVDLLRYGDPVGAQAGLAEPSVPLEDASPGLFPLRAVPTLVAVAALAVGGPPMGGGGITPWARFLDAGAQHAQAAHQDQAAAAVPHFLQRSHSGRRVMRWHAGGVHNRARVRFFFFVIGLRKTIGAREFAMMLCDEHLVRGVRLLRSSIPSEVVALAIDFWTNPPRRRLISLAGFVTYALESAR